jgi:hypothetical protein
MVENVEWAKWLNYRIEVATFCIAVDGRWIAIGHGWMDGCMMILTLQGREGFANGQPWMPLRISSLPNRISAHTHLASFAFERESELLLFYSAVWIAIQHKALLE